MKKYNKNLIYIILTCSILLLFFIINNRYNLLYYLSTTKYDSYDIAMKEGYINDEFISSKSSLIDSTQVQLDNENFIIFNYGEDGFCIVNIPKVKDKYIWYRKGIFIGGPNVSLPVETFYNNENFVFITGQSEDDIINSNKSYNIIESSNIFEKNGTYYSLIQVEI